MLDELSGPQRRTTLSRIAEQGFGWVRQRVDWGNVEPQPGHFDWSHSDGLIRDVVAHNLVPLVVLDGSPAWARSPQDLPPTDAPLAPPADPTTFARFAAAFAHRYAESVRFYQLWDEPNIAPHWGNHHIDPVAYAQLLTVASFAIRASDPDAVILLAALAPTVDRGHTAIDEVYFLQRVYAAGAAPAFDAVAVQPFGFGYAPHDSRRRLNLLNFQRVVLVRRVMTAAGDNAKPIVAARFGWNRVQNAQWGTVHAHNQTAFAADAIALARQHWPWLVAMGWAAYQPGRPSDNPLWGFAVTDELARAMEQATTKQARGAKHQAQWQAQQIALLFTLIMLSALVVWRGWVIARSMPWQTWGMRYAQDPRWRPGALWGALLLIYYVATWPPLILLCWLAAAVLLSWQPRVGVLLAALLLPFHIYHKELYVTGWTLLVAPAHAVLLCLLPTLLMQLNRALSNSNLYFRTQPACYGNRTIRPLKNLWLLISQGDVVRNFSGQGYALAVTWLALGMLSANNVWMWPDYWRGIVDLVVIPLLLFCAMRVYCRTDGARRQVAVALWLGGVLAALLGLGVWWQGGGTDADGVQRLVGPHYSPNHTALYLVRTLFLGLGIYDLGFRIRRLRAVQAWNWGLRKWQWVATGIVGAALALTASRGAWMLGVPVGIMVIGFGLRRTGDAGRTSHVDRRLVGVTILAGSGLLALGGWYFGERIANSGTVLARLHIWAAALDMWQAHPLLGVGPNGFFWRFPAHIPLGSALDPNLGHPHNVWLEFASLGGLLGLFWLVAAILVAAGLWRQTLQTNRANPWLMWGLWAALLAGFAHGQVDAFATLPDLAAWNWAVLALLAPSIVDVEDGA